jgi:hypothetical protein
MTSPDRIQRQAEAFVRSQRDAWAPAVLDQQSRDAPELAWRVIEAVTRVPGWESVNGSLAAGPIEDLLSAHGEAFIERVEDLAARDAEFRSCLSYCYRLGMSEAVWARLRAASSTAWVGMPPLPNVRSHPVLGRYFLEWNLRPQWGEEGEFQGAQVYRQASAADFAAVGLLAGDLIVSIDGRRLAEWFDLWHAVRYHPDPRVLSWTIVRAGQTKLVIPPVGVD